MKKKTRKSKMPARRNATLPATKKPATGPADARAKALWGEISAPAQGLFLLVNQIPSEREPNRSALARELAARLHGMMGDGDTLRELARLFEAPEARPAALVALAWKTDAELYASFPEAHPRPRREDVIANIQKTTGCDARTAEKEIASVGLSELFKWKAGRPKKAAARKASV